MDVFILHHRHQIEENEEDVKLIGVYSTRKHAEAAIERMRRLPGFCDTPEGFEISQYHVDTDNWISGFSTVYPHGSEAANDDTSH